MKKLFLAITFSVVFLFPFVVYGKEVTNEEVLSETVKYIKTTTVTDLLADNSYQSNTVRRTRSYSEEVSEEEYNNATELEQTRGWETSIETTYKKLTTRIIADGSYYKYWCNLTWKIMPSVRSYDIIGIGFNNYVKLLGTATFEQWYCTSGSNCFLSYTNYPYSGTRGEGAFFPLMSGSLTNLQATMYFYIQKNTSNTIYTLNAYGDYSHATTTVDYSHHSDYYVGIGGISLNSSISNKYDSIQSADASLSVNW